MNDRLKSSKPAYKKSINTRPALVIEITPEMEYGVECSNKPLN